MTNKIIKSYVCLNVVVSILILSGCGGQQQYNKRYYILDVVRPGPPLKSDNEIILDVRRFTIDAAFGAKGLVYRKGEFEYETDFYNGFLVSPAEMITEKTRNWLSHSGLFQRVLSRGSSFDSTHTLEGNITALYGDLSDKSSPAAVMEISFFLIANKEPGEKVILKNTYYFSSELNSQKTEALVRSLDRCLIEILTNLEKDLRGKL